MPSKITIHQVSPLDDMLSIEALDEPGAGNARHHYVIRNEDNDLVQIKFQNGPIKEAGVNGVSHEALLAIVMDRLEGFQSGPYACADNAEALEGLQKAMEALQRRTKARLARGVEGTSVV